MSKGGEATSQDVHDTLALDARALALAQRITARTSRRRLASAGSRSLRRTLARAQRLFLAAPGVATRPPGSVAWLLDNRHLLGAALRQIAGGLEMLPERRLPGLVAGVDRGRPRIDALARCLVGEPGVRLDLPSIRRFVDAYQEVVALTIAELAALPTMLRRALLWQLVRILRAPRAPAEAPDVERTVRALRVLDEIDWTTFFQKASRVEQILRADPAGAYASMEADARRDYRAVVATLARGSHREEHAIATLALELAERADPSGREAHVGYYLVAEGRAVLEARIAYRATGRERLRRAIMAWPATFYVSSIVVLTLAQWAYLGAVLAATSRTHVGPSTMAVLLLLATGPTSALSLWLLRLASARLRRGRSVPRLAFAAGIPASARTLVAIPRTLRCEADVASALAQLERQQLANTDPQLTFAILTDGASLTDATLPVGAHALVDALGRGVDALNARHRGVRPGPFHALHREDAPTPRDTRATVRGEQRGQLDELRRLLRGHPDTAYARHVGDAAGLLGVRFVITLDEATQLPIGGAKRLVGALAHPLSQASFDPTTGALVAGYAALQPRIETSPSTARETPFTRFFAPAGGAATEPRESWSSGPLGAGRSFGQAIYDLDALARLAPSALVANRASGASSAIALADDLVLHESRPLDYLAFARRLHHRISADWQELPTLLRHAPNGEPSAARRGGSRIDRWRMAVRLRHALDAPLLLLSLASGFWLLGPDAGRWTLAVLSLSVGRLLLELAKEPGRRSARIGRAALALVFLAYEACVALDAMTRALTPTVRARRASTPPSLGFERKPSRHVPVVWLRMLASPALALGGALALRLEQPASLVAAAPLLLAWFSAPAVAGWLGRSEREAGAAISDDERRKLRRLARRTWRFFDAFVGPGDQWLPVDNHQEEPHEQTAHRTSPTNIGLSLLATLSAYDFGYLGPTELSLRLTRAFESIARLPHHQGHLLNWYDSRSLAPLEPRYVSTVDSGNFAGCLLALASGCREVADAPVLRAETWEGLRDSIDLLAEVVATIPAGGSEALAGVLARLQTAAIRGRDHVEESATILATLDLEIGPALDRALLLLVETGARRHEADLLLALRTSVSRLHQQISQMRRELAASLPWLEHPLEAALHGLTLPITLSLSAIPSEAARLRKTLAETMEEARASGSMTAARMRAGQLLDDDFRRAAEGARRAVAALLGLADRAEREAHDMRFGLLYDEGRRLFRVGYNLSADALDPGCYDLLASEARLASYLAIVKGDVPDDHWRALGRPLTRVHGAPVLLSWAGTMFEYLMPMLLMRSRPGSLLERSYAGAVDAQIDEGRKRGVPWGISESAYALTDGDGTYQYRAFGVSDLGLRRAPDDDLVVAPYASLLALSVRPRAVLDNLGALEERGMVGPFGLYEALDLTPSRAPATASGSNARGRPGTTVRSYMAHHQAMVLLSLGNFLNSRSMVERFHEAPIVQTGEPLLDEAQAATTADPRAKLDAAPRLGRTDAHDESPATPVSPTWQHPSDASPEAFVLGNGRLSTLVTSTGGGGLRWNKLALTRYEPSTGEGEEGIWLYVRDEATRRLWRATSRGARTTFAADRVELHQRSEGISLRVAIVVTPADDVEIRQITLHNESEVPRRLGITSAGRPVLFDAVGAPAHPAFSSLFVESEWIADLEALVFSRRAQTPDESSAVLVHRLVHEGSRTKLGGYESDRAAFFGRGGDPSAPAALGAAEARLVGHVGAVLDPLMSVQAQVALPAGGSVTFAFVTTVARSRNGALALARKYGSMHAVRWAFRDADRETPRRLARTGVSASLLPAVQRLCTALIFPRAELAAPRAPRSVDAPCQERLWGRGISGDDPLVVFAVKDASAPLLSELVAAHRYLASCGLVFELVLVDEHVGGYANDAPGTVRHALGALRVLDQVDRRGGIFVVSGDQIDERERQHLEACAQIFVRREDTSLGAVLDRRSPSRAALPLFVATLPSSASVTPPPPRAGLLFDHGFGGFSADGREYVIDVAPASPPPAPWCNVLANADFGCLVSESSLGMSWSLNSGENRLTPWPNDPVHDRPAEALYLRDEETAEIWTSTRLPAGRDAPTRVRHGAGYTVYERESHGLVQRMTVFVPPGASLKVVHLQLRNTLPRPRRLTATYRATWVLGSRVRTHVPHVTTDFDRENACLLASSSWSTELGGRIAFLASAKEAHGFTNDLDDFLGPEGDPSRPDGLRRWGLSGSISGGAKPGAVLQIHLDLQADEQIGTHFVLGQAATRGEALALVARYRRPELVAAARAELGTFWDGILDAIRVATPDPAMDLMLNRWLLYQSLSSRVFGRTGFYQSSGAFGFRDQLQDVLALLQIAPAIARAHIVEAARHQLEEGDVLHWWHPPGGRGVRTRCSDDLAWLPYVVCAYVATTGDVSILEERSPFLVGAALRAGEHDRYARFPTGDERASLLEHCRRALERAATSGAHGLPLMGGGDWNDGMSRIGVEGRGESVWLAWFLRETMQRFAGLLEGRGEGAEAKGWRARADALREAVDASAWDGAWYVRAFHDDGSVVGSAGNQECRIDSLAQSWAALSADPDEPAAFRTRQAVLSADEQLVRPHDRLVRLFWPPFDRTAHDPGYIAAYPPGVRENGGQYTHAATWLGLAHVALGDGRRAERIFSLLNPIRHALSPADVARYRVEPYALAADVYGCEPWIGRGGWTLYTGAAAWLWRLGVEGILGVQRVGGLLCFDPCIPPSWPGFEAWIRVGEQTVHVVVENPDGVARGVRSLVMDGALVAGPCLSLDPAGQGTREIVLRLGAGTVREEEKTSLPPDQANV